MPKLLDVKRRCKRIPIPGEQKTVNKLDRMLNVRRMTAAMGVCGLSVAGLAQGDEINAMRQENLRLKAELKRAEEERDGLKKAAAISTGQSSTGIYISAGVSKPKVLLGPNQGILTYGSEKS